MSLAPHTPDLGINNKQPSTENDWLSNADLSAILDADPCSTWYFQAERGTEDLSDFLDLDLYYSESNAETVQQNIEKPHLENESTAEETRETSPGVIQQTKNASARISDRVASMPLGSTVPRPPKPTVQPLPVTDSGIVEGKSKSLPELEQETQDQLRKWRYKLQQGLWPKEGQLRAEMKEMSSCLKKLEGMVTPSRSAALATSSDKLLKKITNSKEIPEAEISFKKRAGALLEKWKSNWEKEVSTTSSTLQPIGNHSITLNANPDDKEPAESSDTQQLLDKHGKASTRGLTVEYRPEIVAEPRSSCKSTSDCGIEASLVPANENPLPHTAPVLAAQDSKSRTGSQVVDLTDDSEADRDTGSELPHQPTNHQGSGPGLVKGAQTTRSSLTPDSDQPLSRDVLENKASVSPSISCTSTKRKWSDASSGQSSSTGSDTDWSKTSHPGILQSSTTAAKPTNNTPPIRPRKQQKISPRQQQKTSPRKQHKTSPRQHLHNEISWMNESVRRIDMMLDGVEEELDANRELSSKLVGLLEKNGKHREAIMKRRREFIELKEYQLAWGAQDEKVTDEWELSE